MIDWFLIWYIGAIYVAGILTGLMLETYDYPRHWPLWALQTVIISILWPLSIPFIVVVFNMENRNDRNGKN